MVVRQPSLANAIIRKEDKKGMDNLFVPMKLTVLNVDNDMSEEDVERYNNITKTISKCANCQNPVSDADFFSNHPFHVMMEKLSQKRFLLLLLPANHIRLVGSTSVLVENGNRNK